MQRLMVAQGMARLANSAKTKGALAAAPPRVLPVVRSAPPVGFTVPEEDVAAPAQKTAGFTVPTEEGSNGNSDNDNTGSLPLARKLQERSDAAGLLVKSRYEAEAAAEEVRLSACRRELQAEEDGPSLAAVGTQLRACERKAFHTRQRVGLERTEGSDVPDRSEPVDFRPLPFQHGGAGVAWLAERGLQQHRTSLIAAAASARVSQADLFGALKNMSQVELPEFLSIFIKFDIDAGPAQDLDLANCVETVRARTVAAIQDSIEAAPADHNMTPPPHGSHWLIPLGVASSYWRTIEWQFHDGPRGWQPYGAEEQEAFVAARTAGKMKVTLTKKNKTRIRVDFFAMTQTNMATGTVRTLRAVRKLPSEPSPEEAAVEEGVPPEPTPLASSRPADAGVVQCTFTKPGSLGMKLNAHTGGALVVRVHPGSQGEDHPQLCAGLLIRRVGDKDVTGMEYASVLRLLQQAKRPVTLSFEKMTDSDWAGVVQARYLSYQGKVVKHDGMPAAESRDDGHEAESSDDDEHEAAEGSDDEPDAEDEELKQALAASLEEAELRQAIANSMVDDGSSTVDEQLAQAVLDSIADEQRTDQASLRDRPSTIYVQGATTELRDGIKVDLSRGLAGTTVLMLKCLIYRQVQYPLDQMTVQLAGQADMDDDDETLADCGVEAGATVYVANKIRGGGGGGVRSMFGRLTRAPSMDRQQQQLEDSVGESAYLKAFAPREIVPDAKPFMITVTSFTLAHAEVVNAEEEGRNKVGVGNKGPLRLRPGALVAVRLEMPDGFETDGTPDSFTWTGAYGTAQFAATCLRGAELGSHMCKALIDVDDRREAVLHFELNVVERRLGSPPATPPSAASAEVASELTVAERSIDFASLLDITETSKRGTFGAVYQARWKTGGSLVAIKALGKATTDAAARRLSEFEQECSFALTVSHPNLVLALGVTEGKLPFYEASYCQPATTQPMLVMEWLEYNLTELLQDVKQGRAPPLSPDALDGLASGIVSGMIYLHKHKGIAHCDLKPDNILIDNGRPKIADFGLSRSAVDELVQSPTICAPGTAAFMAPEVLQGNISTKADVYSFGVVLWEMTAPVGVTVEAAWAKAAFGPSSPSSSSTSEAEAEAGAGAGAGAGMGSAAIPHWARNGDLRPAIPESVDQHWRACVEQCWRPDPDERPTFMEIKANFFPELSWPLSTAVSPRPTPTATAPSSTMAQRRGVGKAAWVPRQPSETEVTLWLRAAGLGRIAHTAAESEEWCDMESFEALVRGYGCGGEAAEVRVKQFTVEMKLDEREELCLRSALDALLVLPAAD